MSKQLYPNTIYLLVLYQVPSGEQVRTVGFEDPETHQLKWFNLKKGVMTFVPSIGLYFKLDPIV